MGKYAHMCPSKIALKALMQTGLDSLEAGKVVPPCICVACRVDRAKVAEVRAAIEEVKRHIMLNGHTVPNLRPHDQGGSFILPDTEPAS